MVGESMVLELILIVGVEARIMLGIEGPVLDAIIELVESMFAVFVTDKRPSEGVIVDD